ncbi:MAG: radical SAM protein [Thermodesulfobacteriota bacterium]
MRVDPGGRISVALVYPNEYSPAMSNLGFQTLYRLLNSMEGCLAERAFLPHREDFREYERSGSPLFTLESERPLHDFDIVAFSISFEDDYLNIPGILRLSRLSPLAVERTSTQPLVIAGGIAPSLNPWPIADFMDLFIIGEAEGAVEDFFAVYSKAVETPATKETLLKTLDALDFTFIPSLYELEYGDDILRAIKPLKGAKTRVLAKKNMDLKGFIIPENFIRTPLAAFKKASLLEIERGCGRGCRFCAAGFVCLPERERDPEKVMEAVRRGAAAGKVGLVGTAVSDYSNLNAVVEEGVKAGAAVTLSSMRLDVLDKEKLALLKRSGYRTVTLAPEAGSERMRVVINKGLTEEEILGAVRMVREAGFGRMKLYFLFGLPTERDEDAGAIVDLITKIQKISGGAGIAISLNPFIPKPFTPFQWSAFEAEEVLKRRLKIIKKGVSALKGVSLKTMPVNSAFFQAYLARGDIRAGELILEAGEVGVRRSLKKRQAFMERSVYRERTRDEVLPWDIVDFGVKKNYLWSEYERAKKGLFTGPCQPGCVRCGVCPPAAQ